MTKRFTIEAEIVLVKYPLACIFIIIMQTAKELLATFDKKNMSNVDVQEYLLSGGNPHDQVDRLHVSKHHGLSIVKQTECVKTYSRSYCY